MELATGPLPSRRTAASPTERGADAWGDFLRRVLVPVGRDRETHLAAVEAEPRGTLLNPAVPSKLGSGLAAE